MALEGGGVSWLVVVVVLRGRSYSEVTVSADKVLLGARKKQSTNAPRFVTIELARDHNEAKTKHSWHAGLLIIGHDAQLHRSVCGTEWSRQ